MNKKTNDLVTRWVIDTVKKKYSEDIALVVSHTTLRIDGSKPCVSYFVPITDRGSELARTFILDGTGYDIWGIPWERLEGFAELREYNITVLADSEILYAKNEEWANRFEELKAKLRRNLSDGRKMRECALEAYAQAKALYTEMLFAKRSDVRMTAGYVLDYLARAVAFSGHTYFKKSQTEQFDELKQLSRVPEGFCELYLSVIKEKDGAAQKEKCFKAVQIIREFLEKAYPSDAVKERNFQDLSDWYAELSYTWLRLRHYAEKGDFVKVYMWGIFLQNELNEVCADFSLDKPELMECYDWENLDPFIKRANELEKMIREAIKSGGGVIREYNDEEEFLNENI